MIYLKIVQDENKGGKAETRRIKGHIKKSEEERDDQQDQSISAYSKQGLADQGQLEIKFEEAQIKSVLPDQRPMTQRESTTKHRKLSDSQYASNKLKREILIEVRGKPSKRGNHVLLLGQLKIDVAKLAGIHERQNTLPPKFSVHIHQQQAGDLANGSPADKEPIGQMEFLVIDIKKEQDI